MPVNNHLHIVAGFKDDKTYLKESYCAQPLRVADITEDRTGDFLKLMIVSSSPGVLDDDKYMIEVDVEANAKIQVTTQGYQRLFSMNNHASQMMNVHVHNRGSFFFLPHPNVPHKASDFLSVNNIYLSPEHDFLWSEIITCGRKCNGEEFQFTRFHNVTSVYIGNKLVVKENVLLEPTKTNVHAIGQMEGFTHQSTLLFINNRVNLNNVFETCLQFLSGIDDIIFGISVLPVKGLVIRILGQKAEKLFDCNNNLAVHIRELSRLSESAELSKS